MTANLRIVDGVNEFTVAIDFDAVELFQRTATGISLGGVVPFERHAQGTILATRSCQLLRSLWCAGLGHGKYNAVAHEVMAVGVFDIGDIGCLQVNLKQRIARANASVAVGNILRRRVLIHIEVHLAIVVVVDKVAGTLILEGHLPVVRIGASVLHGTDILTVARGGVDLIQATPVAHAIEVAIVGHGHAADGVRVVLRRRNIQLVVELAELLVGHVDRDLILNFGFFHDEHLNTNDRVR